MSNELPADLLSMILRQISYNPDLKRKTCENCHFAASRFDASNLDYPNTTVCTLVAALGEFKVDKNAVCDKHEPSIIH